MNPDQISTQEQAIKFVEDVYSAGQFSVSVNECIRFQPGKVAILLGEYNREAAVFRVALSPKSFDQLSDTIAEMIRISPNMNSGSNRISQVLNFDPNKGILIVRRAKGMPFLESIKQNSDKSFAPQLANWLKSYAAPTLTTRKANLAHWMKQAAKSSARQPHQSLIRLESEILARMQHLVTQIDGHKWRVAITHGDYHPNNLFWDGKQLTGIDIGGSAYLPIYKDMARCLVHLARRDIWLGSDRKFGVDQSLFQAFTEEFKLSEFESSTILPFFIAFECLIKVELQTAPNWRLEAAEKLYERYLNSAS